MKTETYDTTYIVNNNELPCTVEYERQFYTQEEMQVFNCRAMEIEITAIWVFPSVTGKGYDLMDEFSWLLSKGSVFELEEEIRKSIDRKQREDKQEALLSRECEGCF